MSQPVNEKTDETETPALAPRPTAEVFSMQSLRAIGHGLRSLYGAVVSEPVPGNFIDILKDIDERDGAEKSEAPAEKTSAKIYVLGVQVSRSRPAGDDTDGSAEGGE